MSKFISIIKNSIGYTEDGTTFQQSRVILAAEDGNSLYLKHLAAEAIERTVSADKINNFEISVNKIEDTKFIYKVKHPDTSEYYIINSNIENLFSFLK